MLWYDSEKSIWESTWLSHNCGNIQFESTKNLSRTQKVPLKYLNRSKCRREKRDETCQIPKLGNKSGLNFFTNTLLRLDKWCQKKKVSFCFSLWNFYFWNALLDVTKDKVPTTKFIRKLGKKILDAKKRVFPWSHITEEIQSSMKTKCVLLSYQQHHKLSWRPIWTNQPRRHCSERCGNDIPKCILGQYTTVK